MSGAHWSQILWGSFAPLRKRNDVIELQAAPCRTAVSIFGDKRALVTVTLKYLLADSRWDVASCGVVRPLLSSAGQMASERHRKDAVDQVLLTKVSEAFLGFPVE
jgi:hypothetical protein